MTSVARRQEHDSGDYSDASHQENDQDTSGNVESDYDSAASDSERSDRDPDNQETERRVDDDEDRSNPQYIPKRGTFYEHDDRTADNGEESSNTISETLSDKKDSDSVSERRRGPRKSESINKWSHDKFNENEQMPKSRDELVAIYGYDIRNEDAPPHARRNRRYGRGPTKYTRTWEDEEAYRRQAAAAPQPRKPPNPEDFPELEAGVRNSKKRAPRPRSKSQPSSTESVENGQSPHLRRNASIKARPKPRAPARPPPKKEEIKEKLPPIENLTITANVNYSLNQSQRKVNATVAQQRPVPTDQGKKKPTPPTQSQQQNNTAPSKPLAQQQQKPQQQVANQQQQESRGGSKRYSSLRQRPLDTYSPQAHRYHEFNAGQQPPTSQHQTSPAPHPQQMMQQMHRNPPVNQSQHGPSPPHQQITQQQIPQQQLQQQQIPQQQITQQQIPQQQITQQQIPQQQITQQQIPQQQIPQQQIPQQQIQQQHSQQQVRIGILEQQQMVSHPHHTIHNMPPPQHSMGQLQPAQGYAPPAMMPAQYMQQVSGVGGVNVGGVGGVGVGVNVGAGGVFGGAPLFPPAPYAHQHQHQHQLYAPPPHHNYVQGAAAGGVTYYSCAEQEPLPRAQRRPTNAIPIVRPAIQDRSANSSEKENIDRIVENMFVRKPWPATHNPDSKEKSETRNSQEPASKESSQPNSLTSSSISTDSKPSESIEQPEQKETATQEKESQDSEPVEQASSISTEA